MTLDQIRTAVRSIIKENETDSGALFPSNNTLLDFYINMACEQVVLDLVEFIPECFLTYEDISLTANTNPYTLTTEWIQIWAMLKNVTNEAPRPLLYITRTDEAYKKYAGETAEDPEAWTLYGDNIEFLPTPASDKSNHYRCWIIAAEASTMAATGPAYIPRMAHKLIPLYAGVLIAETVESTKMDTMLLLYQKWLTKVTDVIGFRVQQQPRFLGESFRSKRVISTLDPAFYDIHGFFED